MSTDAGMGSSQEELVIAQVFDAPRELVFKAWAEAERLAKWWGPKGSTIHVAAFDLRAGGIFHYGLRYPDGNEMWGKFVYHEVVVPERIVFANSFADAQGNTMRAPFSADWPLEILNTLTLTESEGKTTLTLRGGPLNATEAEHAIFESMRSSMQQGFGGTFDQLDEYLAQS